MAQTELIDRFVASAIDTLATVQRIPSNGSALNSALLQAAGGDELIFLAEPDDIAPELFTQFKKNERVIVGPTRDQMRTIRVGVTDAFCGIASTGSICVSITRNLSGPASSLTRKHIAVVEGRTILPRPRDVFSEEFLGGRGLSRSFSFITGPSATADMGPLVHGVHGPGILHIIILE